VIVLDDAFQHRAIGRDLNILVLDATTEIWRERLLPAGLRREGLSAMRRADLVVWSGVTHAEDRMALEAGIRRWYQGPSAGIAARLVSYRNCADGRRAVTEEFRRKPALAFCGIGRPERFLRSLGERGLEMKDAVTFRDHRWYAPADLEHVLDRFAASGAELIVTTEKDAVRLEADPLAVENFLRAFPVWYPELDVSTVWGEEHLNAALGLAG
jgi:tetraacyldisaccharide 4'-kinase